MGAAGPEPDADGHTIMAGPHTGFGSGYMVEVRILESASKGDAVAMLRKMADRLEEDSARLTDAERHEPEHDQGEFRPRPPESRDLPF